jgi:hypothetical protein
VSDSPDANRLIRVLRDLKSDPELQGQQVDAQSLDPCLAALRRWQSGRLSRTYADLLLDPHYEPACRFFLSDIYAPRDFSQRDQDVERMHAILGRIFPSEALRLTSTTIELNHLSSDLDSLLLAALSEQGADPDSLTDQEYAAAYRRCDNYPDRMRQIKLLAQAVRWVGEGARLPLVSISLRVAKVPAHAAGWGEMHDFITRGHQAFKQMKNGQYFSRTIEQRETTILDRIFASHPDPFNL